MMSRPDYMFKKIVLVFLNRGETVRVRNDNIIVTDEDGKIKLQTTCYRVFSLWIIGNFTITTPALRRAKKFGYSIFLFTPSFRVIEAFAIPLDGNTLLREKQYMCKSNVEIAKWIVQNKVENQYKVLMKSRKNDQLYSNAKNKMRKYIKEIDKIDNDKTLLGIEGSASRIYFNALFNECNWSGRRPRVKHDINNSLLDIGYTLLFSVIEALLMCYGFDLYVGIYHKIFYKRKSLVCDLVEPFRCIVDYQIKKMNTLNMIDPDDFQTINHQYVLSYQSSNDYIYVILKSILEHREEMFMFVQSYYRVFIQDKSIENFPKFIYS